MKLGIIMDDRDILNFMVEPEEGRLVNVAVHVSDFGTDLRITVTDEHGNSIDSASVSTENTSIRLGEGG